MSVAFNLKLNTEQKEAKRLILNNTLSVISGKAGSGKTLLACEIALDALLNKKECDKIIITRPSVSKEQIGFLPGDLYEKMDPFLQPVYQNFYLLYNRSEIDRLISEGVIEVVPIAFMRGRTFLDTYVIVDEGQNLTKEQMKMVLERIGTRSKMMVCGDSDQIDLNKIGDSGFQDACDMAKSYVAKAYNADGTDVNGGICYVELLENHRSPIVDYIINYYIDNNVSTKMALHKITDTKKQGRKKTEKTEKTENVQLLTD